MAVTQKKTLLVLMLLGLLYFGIFIFANRLGAKNVDMMAVFEVDEYAQYPYLAPMLSGGGSIKQVVRNFMVYGHYYYGYPFYFFSGLVLLPLRLILGQSWTANTQLSMLILRQMVNVLPNLLSALVLTTFATQLRSFWKSIAIFSLLLITPALVNNGFWWHPDGLGLLFVSLVFLCLLLDKMQFGQFFLLASVCAGLAAGVKYLGLFFFFTIPVYLITGVIEKKISVKAAALKGALFLVVMLLVVVISNPLLLLPLERSELIATQLRQFSRTSAGEIMGRQSILEGTQLPGWLTEQYGSLPFLLFVSAALIYGFFKPENRMKALLIASYILPLSMVILSGALQRQHYWLPVFLPMATSMTFLMPESISSLFIKPVKWAQILLLGLLTVQGVIFTHTDFNRFDQMLKREQQSASLTFYQDVKDLFFKDNQSVSVYRDWKVYFPSDEQTGVFMDWDLASYELISQRQPDYLLLEKVNVLTYGNENFLASSADPERLSPMHLFYSDALKDKIEGYHLIFSDDFGLVFQRIV